MWLNSLRFAPIFCLALLGPVGHAVHAQTVQPAIVEYSNKADGKFAVTNNTTDVMTVIMEPKSFSIGPDGRGTFRGLDPGIRVELSAMSVRLQPLQTYWVFYKAVAETYPSWFTIYSTFIPLRKRDALNVRFQLPHTVYMYQKEALAERSVEVSVAKYNPSRHELVCDLGNPGRALGRVQDVQLSSAHGEPAIVSGFPLLPGSHRHLVIPWTEESWPTSMRIRFEHFTLKPQVQYQGEIDSTTASTANRAPLAALALLSSK